mgnify:FL=1
MPSLDSALNRLERLVRQRSNEDTSSYSAYKARSRLYRHDPSGYVTDCLKQTLTPQQSDICNLLTQPPYCILVPSANTQGKCVHPLDFIPLASGKLVPACTLVGTSFQLLSLDSQGRNIVVDANAEYDSIQSMYEIVLESGEILRRTYQHPVWATRGEFKNGRTPKVPGGSWVHVEKLQSGDLVAIPMIRENQSTETLTDSEIKVIAYMIGDGGCTTSSGTFTQQENKQLAEFRECIRDLDTEITLSDTPYMYRLRKIGPRSSAEKNGVKKLLDRVGIGNAHSRDKFIPDSVMSSSRRQQKLFLSRLYATDGWATVGKTKFACPQIGFCSISERLVRDVKELLSRFGIRSTLVKRDKVNAWVLSITSGPDCLRFAAEIGIYGKEEAVNEVVTRCDGAKATKWREYNPPSGCRWEKIKSITRIDDSVSVAISVPGVNTFLTSIYEHNTFLGASIASWFYDTHDPGIGLITAPTRVQVRDLIFRELRTIRPANDFQPVDTRLQSSPNHFLHGLTAKSADAFRGRHCENLLLGFDEGTGIHPEFYRRAFTMFGRHPGHYWFVLYNPIDPSTPPYALEESGLFHTYRLNALEHANITYQLNGLDPLIPSAIRLETLVSRLTNPSECVPISDSDADPTTDFQFPTEDHLNGFNYRIRTPLNNELDFFAGVRDRLGVLRVSDWGLQLNQWYRPVSPWFESQILGRWPMIGTDSVFTPALCDKAFNNVGPFDFNWQLQIGCDVARVGTDETTFAVRRGPALIHVEKHSQRDTTWIADRAYELAKRFSTSDSEWRFVRFVVDGTGGYGGGVVDQIRGRLNCIELHFSSQSPDPKVLRMRSYLYFRLQAFALAGLLDFSRLTPLQYKWVKDDLISVRYRMDEQDRKVLESKKQIKDRIGRSPDVADAVCLAYYEE